ncbi:MAG: hypothetical protein R2827_00900 [Bdellovibrionales bacterium]
MYKKLLWVCVSALLFPALVGAQSAEIAEPIGESTSTPSKWSSFYQYQHRDLRNPEASLNGDMVPENIILRAHLIAISYQLNSDWQAEVGTQYLDMDVRLLGNRMDINAGSRGLSDLELYGVRSWETSQSQTVMKVGLSVPTGSIDKTDSATVNMGRRGNVTMERILPYQGQLGSGTYDALFEVNRRDYFGANVYWRNKIKLKARTGGRNDMGYRLGDEGKWMSELNFPLFGKYLTGMIGGTYKTWGEVTGSNPVIEEIKASMPFPMDIEDIYSKSGERLESYVALKSGVPVGPLGILTFEIGQPLSSYVSGNDTELGTNWYSYVNLITEL